MERTHRTNSVKEVVTRSLLGESIILANKTSPTHPLSSIPQYKIQPQPTQISSITVFTPVIQLILLLLKSHPALLIFKTFQEFQRSPRYLRISRIHPKEPI